jgi:hypothetical protein
MLVPDFSFGIAYPLGAIVVLKEKKAMGYFYWQSVFDHGLGAARPQ